MKSVVAVCAVVAVLTLVPLGNQAQAQFAKGKSFLGPNLTLATDPIGLGVDYEYGLNENVGLGGMVRYWGRSVDYAWGSSTWSVIMPQFQAAYHFMPGEQFDPYAGARLGFAIYSSSHTSDIPGYTWSDSNSGGLYLSLSGGARYFFSPKISANGSIEIRAAGDDYFGSSLGLVLGVDFTL